MDPVNEPKKSYKLLIYGLIALLPVLLPLVCVVAVFIYLKRFLIKSILKLVVRFKWLPHGKDTLIVYSDSSKWKELFEKEIIPKIEERSIVINWSQHYKLDKSSLPFLVYKNFAGLWPVTLQNKKVSWTGDSYLPYVIRFSPWWAPMEQRYWKAFSPKNRNKEQTLEELLIKIL